MNAAFLERAQFHCSFSGTVILGLDLLCEQDGLITRDPRSRGVRCNGERRFHKYLFAGRTCPRQEQMGHGYMDREKCPQRVNEDAFCPGIYCILVINHCSLSYWWGCACVVSASLPNKDHPAGSGSQ